MSAEDDIRAIELVDLKKSNGYILNKTHIQFMSRVSQNNPAATTKGPVNKAKVNPGEYRNLKHRFKCHGCNRSYNSKIDIAQHNALIHAQRHCIICNAYAIKKTERAKKCKKEYLMGYQK